MIFRKLQDVKIHKYVNKNFFQGGQVYLTILNLHSHACKLEDLDEHLLRALFKSQRPDHTSWHAQMQKDLLLTLDWNSPHVAMSEVFLKDPSNKFK
ncbi:transient receptor potential cation channel subfamily M member 6, partial [Nephila pilipes]